MIVKKEDLDLDLLKRVESIDNKFIGYTGNKYVYILDCLISQRNATIINVFFILNEIDEDTFIAIPNKTGGFYYETSQEENRVMTDIDNNVIYIYDQSGNVVVEIEEVITGYDENGDPIIVEVENRILRYGDVKKNIKAFSPILVDPILKTIKRVLGEKI
jgi:hypothetical protein